MPLQPSAVLKECSATTSTVAKAQVLAANATEELKKILNYALDPFKVYGIKQFEFAKPDGGDEKPTIYPEMFKLLEKFMRREITGDAARNEIKELSRSMTEHEQDIFFKILKKDLKCGVAEGIVNKTFPKLIPEFEIQLAQPSKFLKRVRYPCLVQAKYDGVRVVALTEPKENDVTYYSRNGKQFMNFSCFNKELLQLSNREPKMFDGEVIGPRGDDFRGIMQQCRRKFDVEPKGLNFNVFDWMPMHHFVRQNTSLTQTNRTSYLDELRTITQLESQRVFIVVGVKCYNEEQLMAYYDQCVTEGYEGVIIKDLDGEYEFKRSVSWIKMKPSDTIDLKVTDIQEGKGKYAGKLGAFIVDREGVTINVGSGLKDDERVSLEEAHKLYIGKTIEIEFDSITPDKSLRFPRFKCLREDKNV
jgi:DNA ligase-1